MNKVIGKKVSELVDVFNNIRVPLSSKQRESLAKIYPYYGAQGIVDYVDKYLFDGEYILIAEDGENLKSNNQNICNIVEGKFWVNNHAHIVRANAKNSTKYLYYNFNRIKFEPYVTGSSQPKLNKENLLNINVFVHDNISTQQSIVKVLSDLDAKIELNNRINQELEAMAKTLYDYWFVQFDFPNEEGKPYKNSGGLLVWNDQLKRNIPEGWEVKKLGDLGNFKNGVNYDPSKPGNIACPIINVRNISASSFFIKNEDLDVVYLNESEVQKYSVHNGSIIVARSGIPGATRLISDCKENTLYCGFAIHFELNNMVNKIPVFFYLKSIEKQLQNGSGGTILKNVNQGTLNALQISLPTSNLIVEKFNNLIDPIFGKINLIEKENQHLASLRDWLLPMLMNGQITVCEAGKEIENNEKPIINLSEQQDQRFELWLNKRGIAARGEIDTKTLRDIFDAMDDEDK